MFFFVVHQNTLTIQNRYRKIRTKQKSPRMNENGRKPEDFPDFFNLYVQCVEGHQDLANSAKFFLDRENSTKFISAYQLIT